MIHQEQPLSEEGGAEPGLGGNGSWASPRDGRPYPLERGTRRRPRITEDPKDRALRLKTLGNAVCPPQAYPIFHYIFADRDRGVRQHLPLWTRIKSRTKKIRTEIRIEIKIGKNNDK